MGSRFTSSIFLAAVLAPSFIAASAAFAGDQGVHLAITYQVDAADRPAAWDYAVDQWTPRLDALLHEGIFDDYRLLFNSYVEDYTWDLMLVVGFDDYAKLEEWKAIEKKNPGSLDTAGLELVTPDHSFLFNRRFKRRDENVPSDNAVYFSIPYEYNSEADYVKYVEVYVLPQFDRWIDGGILSGYEVYLNRHATGKPWDVLLLLEYRDTKAFGQRDSMKWSVRAELDKDTAWKLVSSVKQKFRTEGETVIAERVQR